MLEYKEIPGINPIYRAGSDGNIYSFYKETPKKLKAAFDGKHAYTHVSVIMENGTRKSQSVHRLVCAAFHGPKPFDVAVVAHNDGDPLNCSPNNLRWTTQKDNHADRYLHGTHDNGLNNTRAKIDKDLLFVIRYLLENTTLTQQEIAGMFNLNRVFVTKIHNRHRYKNCEVKVVEC